MRRIAHQLAAGAAALGMLAVYPAAAQMQCLSPPERAAFEVQALRSELMVVATGCSSDSQYNAFINRYKPELMANEREIKDYFQHRFGKRGQTEHDRFVTELANAQASGGSKMGSEFCPHNKLIFAQAMALPQASDLTPFAAGQSLMPASLDVCPVQVAQRPPAKSSKRH